MLFDRIDREWSGWIGRRWQDVRKGGDSHDIGRVTTTRALGMQRVNRPATNRCDCRLQKTGLIDGIGVYRDMNLILIRNGQAGIYRGGSRPPILVQLQTANTGLDLRTKRIRR